MKSIINRRGSKAATRALKRLGRSSCTVVPQKPVKVSEKPQENKPKQEG